MPYIKKDRRHMFRFPIDVLSHALDGLGVTGNLNYVLYNLAKKHCTNYASYAAFIGELEAAKLEIYRKLVAPYEELKEKENGSI